MNDEEREVPEKKWQAQFVMLSEAKQKRTSEVN